MLEEGSGGGYFLYSPPPLLFVPYHVLQRYFPIPDIQISDTSRESIPVKFKTRTLLYSSKHIHSCIVQNTYIPVQFDTQTFLYNLKHVHSCTVRYTHISVPFDTHRFLYIIHTILYNSKHVKCFYNFNKQAKYISEKNYFNSK